MLRRTWARSLSARRDLGRLLGRNRRAVRKGIGWIENNEIIGLQPGEYLQAVAKIAADADGSKPRYVLGFHYGNLRPGGAKDQGIGGYNQRWLSTRDAERDFCIGSRHQFALGIRNLNFRQKSARSGVDRTRSVGDLPRKNAGGKFGDVQFRRQSDLHIAAKAFGHVHIDSHDVNLSELE